MPVERDLKIDSRLIKQLSDSAIKNDLVRALVELITNCDDSYKRLENAGRQTGGIIEIELVRKKENSIIRILDQAEGFDSTTMDERIGGFAFDTSGLTAGVDVRGFFGRGLKEAILGLGRGSVQSIKDDLLNECALNHDMKYSRKDPIAIDKLAPNELKEIGVGKRGSVVEIIISNNRVRIPHFDNFVYTLERYFSLREINSSNKRKLIVVEKDEKKRVKRGPDKIEYKSPIGKEVLSRERVSIDGFENAKFDISILKATEALSTDGYCREGGLLIKSKSSIHDITLFTFENNPYAQKIFGTISCHYIDELLKQGEQIVSDRRNGLDWDHPFCRELKRNAEKYIGVVVDQIKKEEEATKKAIENERTRQRFKTAIEKINLIAQKELEQSGEGPKPGKGIPEPKSPPNGFDFVPEYYHIVAGKRSTLTLRAMVPFILTDKDQVTIEADNDDVKVENKFMKIDEGSATKNIVTLNPRITGKRVGIEAIITAKANNFKAEALVKVVANIERSNKHTDKVQKGREGLISDIVFDETLGPKVRHYFERETKIVKISSKHPSVEFYLGPNGEGQDELHCQVLIAELVMDSICRELARKKAESNQLTILGETMDAINREHYNLINQYAHLIHQALVSSEAKRKANQL